MNEIFDLLVKLGLTLSRVQDCNTRALDLLEKGSVDAGEVTYVQRQVQSGHDLAEEAAEELRKFAGQFTVQARERGVKLRSALYVGRGQDEQQQEGTQAQPQTAQARRTRGPKEGGD